MNHLANGILFVVFQSLMAMLLRMPEDIDTNAEMRWGIFEVPRIPMRFLLEPGIRSQQRKIFDGWKDSAIFYRLFGLMNTLEAPKARLHFSADEWLTIAQYLDGIRACNWVPMLNTPSDEFMELEDDDFSSLIEPARAALALLDEKSA